MTRTARAHIYAHTCWSPHVNTRAGPAAAEELRGSTGSRAQPAGMHSERATQPAGARARSRRCTYVRCVRAGHVATQLRRDVYERNAYAYGMNKQEGVCVRVRTERAHGHVPRARILATLQLQA